MPKLPTIEKMVVFKFMNSAKKILTPPAVSIIY